VKKLYIIRHAKSSWDSDAKSDFNRPLNKRGKRDAPMMGEVLKKLAVMPDIILSSSAKRTTMTALIVAEKIGYDKEIVFEDELYLASDSEIYNQIKRVDDDKDSVFIIAHNPGVTNFINRFSDDYISNLPTCGIFAMEFDVDSFKDIKPRSGKKLFFEYPKKYI
jgi:phosphohistidine phosphatase